MGGNAGWVCGTGEEVKKKDRGRGEATVRCRGLGGASCGWTGEKRSCAEGLCPKNLDERGSNRFNQVSTAGHQQKPDWKRGGWGLLGRGQGGSLAIGKRRIRGRRGRRKTGKEEMASWGFLKERKIRGGGKGSGSKRGQREGGGGCAAGGPKSQRPSNGLPLPSSKKASPPKSPKKGIRLKGGAGGKSWGIDIRVAEKKSLDPARYRRWRFQRGMPKGPRAKKVQKAKLRRTGSSRTGLRPPGSVLSGIGLSGAVLAKSRESLYTKTAIK